MRRVTVMLLVFWIIMLAITTLPSWAAIQFPQPVSIEVERHEATIYFAANRQQISPFANCVDLNWSVENINAVYFNRLGVIGQDTRHICDDVRLSDGYVDYTLDVQYKDGTEETFIIRLKILNSIQNPTFQTAIVAFIFVVVTAVLTRDTLYSTTQLTARLRRILRFGFALLVILFPALFVMLLLYLRQHSLITDLMPYALDGRIYWHQAATFNLAGFNGGYYTFGEQVARIEFFRFIAWGPFIPMLYGSLWPLFGSSLATIPIINLIMITLALAVFVVLVRPQIQQSVLLILIFATFMPFVAYSSLSMMPLVQQCLALMCAVGFAHLIQKGDKALVHVKIGLGIWLIACCLIRPTWGFLFIPYFVLLFINHRIFAILLGGSSFVIAVLVFASISSPWPSVRTDVIEGTASIASIATNVWDNTQKLIEGETDVILYRFTFLVLFVIFGIGLLQKIRHWKSNNQSQQSIDFWSFGVFALGSSFFLMLFFVRVGGLFGGFADVRLTAPFFLLVLLLCVIMRHDAVVQLILVLFISGLQFTLVRFDSIASPATFERTHELVEEGQAYYRNLMQFDPDTSNSWCNTVVMDRSDQSYSGIQMLLPPPGFGITFERFRQSPNIAFKSRYLLLTESAAANVSQNLRLIGNDIKGGIYLNLDAECEN